MPCRLNTLSIKRCDLQFVQINVVETADIDSVGHRSVLILSRGKGRHATVLAEKMMDMTLVELIIGKIVFSREEREVVLFDKAQDRALLGTDRAIACYQSIEFHFNIVSHLTAVTATRKFRHIRVSFHLLTWALGLSF